MMTDFIRSGGNREHCVDTEWSSNFVVCVFCVVRNDHASPGVREEKYSPLDQLFHKINSKRVHILCLKM